MSRLLVATRSRGKQAEFRSLLAWLDCDIAYPDDVGLGPGPAEAALECHDTFVANAAAKARWFATRSGLVTIADDSGLEVDALGGAPGVRSRRFSGTDGSEAVVTAANNALLLERLAAVPDGARTARYRCALVCVVPGGAEVAVSGTCEGAILGAPRGVGGFGYDPLFCSNELGCTFAEANAAAKSSVSHRGRAVSALRAALEARAVRLD